MIFDEVLAAMQRRLGQRVRVHIEGPGPALLADFDGVLATGGDLGAVKTPDLGLAGPVRFTFENAAGAFMLDPEAFVSARELPSGLLRVEQIGEVAFMIVPKD